MKKYNVTVNGKTYEVEVEEVGSAAYSAPAATVPAPAPAQAPAAPAATPVPAPKAAPAAAPANGKPITSPMPGTILKINVAVGQKVAKGEALCILEAMKMENDIVTPEDGVVASVNTQKGASVNSGDLLFTIA